MAKMEKQDRFCMSRREFLLAGSGAAAATVFLRIPGVKGEVEAAEASYPRKLIGRVSELKDDVPVVIQYPFDDIYSQEILVKLGVPAAGGVGPKKDIVAFSTLCSHMGGLLFGKYNATHKALGSCPIHLSTFDLRRHGMVIAGHATQALPQVILEVKKDDIYAVGIRGLVYGKTNNLIEA